MEYARKSAVKSAAAQVSNRVSNAVNRGFTLVFYTKLRQLVFYFYCL